MAFFSFGSDNYRSQGSALKRAASLARPRGKPGTFGGPIQFRPPGSVQSPAQMKEDLTVTQNPFGPKAPASTDKYNRVSGVNIGLKGTPSTPIRPPQERVAAASVIPSSGPAARLPQAMRPPDTGFNAPQWSDLASRVAAMGKAAEGPKIQADSVPTRPQPTSAASTPPH